MTTPAIILTCFFCLTFICESLTQLAAMERTSSNMAVGRCLGLLARYGIIVTCLIMGGFYN